MKDDCLLALKKIVNESTYDRLVDAAATNDQKTWEFTVQNVLDSYKTKRKQLVIDVGLEDGIQKTATRYIYEHPTTEGLRKQIEDETDPKKLTKYRKKLHSKEVRLANDLAEGFVDDSGFHDPMGITSTYKDELAVYGTLVSEVNVGININPKVYGRSVRTMDQRHKIEIVRAIYGMQTKTLGASEIGAAYRRADKYAVQRLRRAGSSLNPLDDYKLTNTYDVDKLTREGREAYIKDHIDPTKYEIRDNPDIINPKYLPSVDRKRFLGEQWDHITSGRGDAIQGVTVQHSKKTKMANKSSSFRHIHPIQPEDWMSSATKYGLTDDPLDVLNGSLQHLAHQIAMMEKWGSDPERMYSNFLGGLRKSVGDDSVGKKGEAIFHNLTSANIDSTDYFIRFLQGVRDFESQRLLGTATLSAFTDIGFETNTAIFTGLSPINVVMGHMKGLVDKGQIELAQELGVITHEALKIAGADHRMVDSGSNGVLRKAVNFMLKASGLNRWTNAGKAAFGLEFLKEMAKIVRGNKIHPKLMKVFERYGISREELFSLGDSIVKRNGVEFLNPTTMDMASSDIQKRVLSMTIELTHSAIPEPGLAIRTAVTAGTRRGTRGHESLKSLTQFMSFPATVAIRGYQRMTDASIPIGSKIGHAVGMAIGVTALGGLVVQAKAAVKGEGWQDVKDPDFWKKAALQGGAGGIVTDVFFSANPLLGSPTLRKLDKVRFFMQENLTREAFQRSAEEWYAELVPVAIQTVEEATGFGTNLWWTKAFFERTAFNLVNRMANPNYDADVRDASNRLYQTNPGNEPWWKPGDTTPTFMQ